MVDIEKVNKGLESCSRTDGKYCGHCPYTNEGDCVSAMSKDVLELLKEQEEERRRMISWLGKFCRHIDNGDKWLSDKENIAFFREKMKQQFGWDS